MPGKVKEIDVATIAGPRCIFYEDAKKVREKFERLYNAGQEVEFSFRGVRSINIMFYAVVFERMFKKYGDQAVVNSVKYGDSEDDRRVLWILENLAMTGDFVWQLLCERETKHVPKNYKLVGRFPTIMLARG